MVEYSKLDTKDQRIFGPILALPLTCLCKLSQVTVLRGSDINISPYLFLEQNE
jgi:hypothetical protein